MVGKLWAAAKAEAEGRKQYAKAGELIMEFHRTGDARTLQMGMITLADTAMVFPEDHPMHAVCLSDLGAAQRNLAERTGDANTLARACEVGRTAVETAVDPKVRAMALSNLGVTLQVMYELTGDPDHLAESEQVGRAALTATAVGDKREATRLTYLGTTLKLQYERTGSLSVLAEAVEVMRRAVDVGSAAEQAAYLGNLGAGLGLLFKHSADPQALAEAIRCGTLAVRATRDAGDRARYAEALSRLAVTYGLSYRRTGDIDDLRRSVRLHGESVAADDGGNIRTVVYLSNLGSALFQLSEQTEELDPLRRAVAAHRAAVTATGVGAPLRGRFQFNLTSALRAQYDRTGDADALAEALEIAQETLAAAPDDHPERAYYLSGLAVTQLRLFHQTRDRAMLERAVATMRACVAASSGAPEAGHLSNLASALRTLADETDELPVLQEAVTRSGQAMAMANPPDRPLFAGKHGINLIAVFERTGDRNALAFARQALAEAADQEDAETRTRINAGLGFARACTLADDHESALAAMTAVLALLPKAAPRELRRHDREYRLGQVSGIAGQAAACALSAGQAPEYAVRLLEQTRGLLIGETMAVRDDLSRLHQHDQGLAAEFARLRNQLAVLQSARFDAGEPRSPQHLAAERNAAARRDADAALDAVIQRIRQESGFAHFLAVPPIDELAWQARSGPIVMIATAPDRGDALILTSEPGQPVRHVPLPGLASGLAARRANEFLRAQEAGDERAIYRILGWLWDAVTGPVLERLGATRTPRPGEPWPRLWWCPVGPMAFLPLHAAGHHTAPADPLSVMDLVVSSYTATIRALGYARRPYGSSHGAGGHPALIVAMPETPGLGDLPAAAREAGTLQRMLPGARLLRGPAATCHQVLAELSAYPIAHFACHGASNWTDPGAGRLYLHDHATNPLTVTAISGLELPDARLAYLSACETTQVSPDLADESVHIATAFQLAGYRSVIGTLYPVDDGAATRIAIDVYEQLTVGGRQAPDTSRAAQALHHAIRRLRDDERSRPSRWVCHAHSGD